MTIDQFLYKYLMTTTLKNEIDTRLYKVIAENISIKPYIVFSIITGSYGQSDKNDTARFQFSIYTENYQKLNDIEKILFDNLQNKGGELITGFTIVKSIFENKRDLYSANTNVFHRAIDIKLIFRRT